MNFVKLRVYIYISYSWIIVACIYLFKYGYSVYYFHVLFLITVLFHFLKINKNRLILSSMLSAERLMLIKQGCKSACMKKCTWCRTFLNTSATPAFRLPKLLENIKYFSALKKKKKIQKIQQKSVPLFYIGPAWASHLYMHKLGSERRGRGGDIELLLNQYLSVPLFSIRFTSTTVK